MFKLHSKFEPTGDQPEAIRSLTEGLNKGEKFQTNNELEANIEI